MKQINRLVLVLALPLAAPILTAQVLTINPLPSREFGQTTLLNPPVSAAPNLVEGRELYSPSGIAFDNSVSPPRVYVTDTGNNRVLGWSNANKVSQGTFADQVLGQESLTATFVEGPNAQGATLSTGMISPTGIAVDANGNVYVVDSGNNRILRFPKPYSQPLGDIVADLVIGQKNFVSGSPNQGMPAPNATTLALGVVNSSTQQLLPSGLAFDSSGNLWVADTGNNRVLRFPASSLNANGPSADTVLGQGSFTSNQLPTQNLAQSNLGIVVDPTGIALDGAGNLYVADNFARVLIFAGPSIAATQNAARVLGVLPASNQPPAYPTSTTLGSTNTAGNTLTGSPQGVFVMNTAQGVSLFVCDSPENRVVRYDNPLSASIQAPAVSPAQSGVIGQVGSTNGQANQGMTNPNNGTFSWPIAGAIRPDTNELWVVDQSNNRALAFANQGGEVYSTASRVLGQTDYIYDTANLIVGSELWISGYGAGMAVDKTSCTTTQPVTCSSPPHLYIADSQNNRVLGFYDARLVGVDSRTLLTQKADLVIGQADLMNSLVNSPTNNAGQPTATGLNHPVGLAVDANGNLLVADSGNSRVLRFPAPFAQPTGTVQTASLVLGQALFTVAAPNISQSNMVEPFGLALLSDGSLAVSDSSANRILVFNRPPGGDFTNGQAASLVIGQVNFSQGAQASSSSNNGFNSPRHIAVDSSDRIYVCDTNNNRLMVFSKPASSNPTAALEVTGFSAPQGVIVSFLTGYSWVASFGNGVMYQLPEFQTLETNPSTSAAINELSSFGPLAVTLDPFDNVVIADSANRVTFYFGELFYRNTASYAAGLGIVGAGPTPTMLAVLARLGSNFVFTPSYSGASQNSAPPWPLSSNNIQVQVNGIPAPIFRVDPAAIYIEIPNEAPTSGPADFVVSDMSTGQILAAATFTMQSASPGIYTTNSGGTGQAAITMYDSNFNVIPGVNGPNNPITPGNTITLWLTGAGNVPGLPADGTPPNNAFYTPTAPTVLIGPNTAMVTGSAISPQFPGLWQINVIVPSNTAPSSITPTSVVVLMDDYHSNIGGTNTAQGGPGSDQDLTLANQLITTIYVK